MRAIVGNETQLHGILDYDDLISYLDQARLALGVPVSTAEPAGIWHKNPELVEHVDFIAMQILPYWQSIEVNEAVEYVFSELRGLQEAYPGKPVIISEVGWPSRGRDRGAAVASVANEATFLRKFLARVPEYGHIYYLMEAFDHLFNIGVKVLQNHGRAI